MKPPARSKTQFERVPKYEEWIPGTILDVEYDAEHKRSFQGEDKVGPCVRLKLGLAGCTHPKRTPWLTFSYSEKSNLYKKYIAGLVEGAEPDMDFDLDNLKEFAVKTMWSENGEYDNLEMIRPLGEKFGAVADKKKEDDEVPF